MKKLFYIEYNYLYYLTNSSLCHVNDPLLEFKKKLCVSHTYIKWKIIGISSSNGTFLIAIIIFLARIIA